MREFVIGDIHGAFKALKGCLAGVQFNYKRDRLIVLGDIVDRNDGSYECVEELLKIQNLIALRGNHDDWFDEFCQTGRHPADWDHGGLETYKSYLRKARGKTVIEFSEADDLLVPDDIPTRHRRFFSELQPYFIDEQGRCFVHGGFNRFLPFTDQAYSTYFWDRELWQAALEWQVNERLRPGQDPLEMRTCFREIFVGHTPTICWKVDVPMRAFNIYNLDTGSGCEGKLSIMEISSKKYFQACSGKKAYLTIK